MKKNSSLQINERDQFIDQINAEKNFEQRIRLIEKLLDPGWLYFTSEIERYITIPLILFDADKKKPGNEAKEKEHQALVEKEEVVQKLIFNFYNAIRVATYQTRNAGKKHLEFGPRTSEEVLLFNLYIIELFFPTSQVIIERFEEMASKSSDESQLVKLETNKFNKLINMVSDEDATSRITSTINYRRTNNKLDWRRTFFNGLSAIIIGAKQADLSKYIPLPELFFYHLGIIYGEFYHYLLNKYEVLFNISLDDKPFLVDDTLIKAGLRVMFLDQLGYLKQLKNEVHAASYLNINFLKALQIITAININTLKVVLSHFNVDADIERAKDKNNPREYANNYDKLIELSSELEMPELAKRFKLEKNVRMEKNLLIFEKFE